MRYFTAALVGLFALNLPAVLAAEGESKCKCPVSARPASKEHAVAYKGRQVYFCCPNCPKAFSKNTEKFAAKADHQLLITGQATQIACPISGRAIDAETAIDVAGAKVAFCCPNCKKKTENSDDPVALVFANFEKGFTVQTKCPVSGKAINAEVSLDHDGKKVFFCCPGCPAGFKKDPEKFTSKLPQFTKK